MRATGWHNGSRPTEAAGYGIKFSEGDRDRHFRPEWSEVILEVDGAEVAVPVSQSFWNRCSELRSAALGRWLLDSGVAPWPRSAPPGIAVEPIEGNRFSARLIKRRSLI